MEGEDLSYLSFPSPVLLLVTILDLINVQHLIHVGKCSSQWEEWFSFDFFGIGSRLWLCYFVAHLLLFSPQLWDLAVVL